ncbi:MAG: hypothetical protein ABI650_07535 [Dokdonella sp.]
MHVKMVNLFIILALSGSVAAYAQTPSASLEERMSQSEFKQAGLNQLSTEQLKFLNDWIAAKQGNVAADGVSLPIRKRDGSVEFYPDEGNRDEVVSRIDGEFSGWRGRTRFKLQNGQIWQQSESGSRESGLNSPEVIIKPAMMGSWLMYVRGCNCSVRVKRIS